MPLSRVTATVASSNAPLKCIIDNPGNGVKITKAAVNNPDGSNASANVAVDGEKLLRFRSSQSARTWWE